MDFVEEKTPKGIILKIFFKKWQFLAFNKRGRPIYADPEGRSLVHNVPLLVFVGNSFKTLREYDQDFILLKVRDGSIVVPYIDLRENRIKYFFIKIDKEIDMIPVRMVPVMNVAQMVKDIDINLKPDYVIVDDGITTNDIIIIKSRYKLEDVIYIELVNNYFLNDRMESYVDEKQINLNMMSSNPVFLARIHLKTMELSKLNQLLLDFEITALDTEYIINFIETLLEKESENEEVIQNRKMLEELRDSYKFYLFLLQRSDNEVRDMISSRKLVKTLAPFRTLVSKVKSIYPGKEEQLLYTEYENMIIDKREELQQTASV